MCGKMKQYDLTRKMCVKYLCGPAVVTNNTQCAIRNFSKTHDSRPQTVPSIVLLSLSSSTIILIVDEESKTDDKPVLRLQAAYIRMSRYADMTFVTAVAIRVIANSILMWHFRYETKWLFGDIYRKLWVTSCSRIIFRTVDNVFWEKC